MSNDEIIKLDEPLLASFNAQSADDILSHFGTWTTPENIAALHDAFVSASPFEHVVIDGFLSDSDANIAADLFTNEIHNEEKLATWHNYCNPIEVKRTFDTVNDLADPLRDIFYRLSSTPVIALFRSITGIDDLTFDPFLHGAGLHGHTTHGRLNVHLDYERHPQTGMCRRLNIILFFSRNWNTELWGGGTELWNADVSECATRVPVAFNRAVIFRTNDISWHGLPEPLSCPPNTWRMSLAYYYVSPFTDTEREAHKAGHRPYRLKASFVGRPHDTVSDGLAALYAIRPHRRITPDDVATHMPHWTPEQR